MGSVNRDELMEKRLFQIAARVADLIPFQCDAAGVLAGEVALPAGVVLSGDVAGADWISADDRNEYVKMWKGLLSGACNAGSCLCRMVGEGGAFLELSAERVMSPEGGLEGFAGVFRDVTGQKRCELDFADVDQLYQAIVDHYPCPLFIKDVDDDFRYLMSNAVHTALCHTFLHEVKPIVGYRDFEIFPQDTAEVFHAHDLLAVNAPDGVFDGIERVLKADGSFYSTRSIKKVIHRKDGRRLLLGMAMDVTSQEKTEHELARATRLLQTIMDNMPCPLFVKDPDNDFRYVMANRAFGELAGVPKEEVPGKTDFDFFPEAAGCYQTDQYAAHDGVIDCKEAITAGDGKLHYVRTVESMTPDFIDGRKLLLGVAIDITQQELMERELARTTRLLQAIMDNMPCPLFVKDPDNEFRYLMANRAFGELAGIPKEEVPGKTDFDFFPEAAGCYQIDQHATRDDGVIDCKEAITAGDGKLHYVRTVESMTTDFIDGRKLLLGLAIDITDQELMERELARTTRLLQAIMDNLPCPLFVKDVDDGFKYVMVNRFYAKFLGRTEEEVVGLTDYDLLRKEDADQCAQTDAVAVREGFADIKEVIQTGDGQTCVIRNVEAMTDYDDGRRLLIGACVDMTPQAEAENRLVAALSAAESANKAKSFFLATVSHELRTPLNAVIGFSEILKQGGMDPAEQADCIETINLAGNSLLNLINDVLDLSKIEADQMEITPQPFDLASILDEIMAIFSYRARQKGIGFSLECPQKLPTMEIDSLRLRQILLNVVGNALKFTEKGEVKLAVDFLPDPAMHLADVVIRVIDTGIGISPEYQVKIFEPFVQQRTLGSNHEGTGLGLTITRRLIEKMGGRIALASEMGKGSTFTITLSGIRYIDDAFAPPREKAPCRPAAACVQTDKIDILIVDDVPVNLKVLAAMLKQFNLDCRTAGSGGEALAAIAEKVPDLVLTDMWMPEMDGQMLAVKIREMPQCAKVKIVSVTADSESKANFDMSLFDDIFLKPLTLDKLRRIFTVLGRKEV